MIFLYVIQSRESKRKYVGITNNLARRLKEHNRKQSSGSIPLGNFTLVHTEKFDDYKKARLREKFLKSGAGRQWLNNYLYGPAKGG